MALLLAKGGRLRGAVRCMRSIAGRRVAATEQAQDGVGSALTQGYARLVAQHVAACPLVEKLDHDRETNGSVQIALRQVEAQAFGQQAQTNHEQEAQAQHHHSRVRVDEARQWLGGQQHHAHGDDDRRHHHGQVIDHAHGGDHRVEREHRVQQHDLRHDHAKAGVGPGGIAAAVLRAFQALVQLSGGLEQQEQPAHQQDEVAPRNTQWPHAEQRCGECDQPGHGRQQHQTHAQRKGQTDDAGPVALCGRQLVGQDGDEYEVVHPQHDL